MSELEETPTAKKLARSAKQSEQNAEEAAFIASLELSEEELDLYLNNPDKFMKYYKKKLDRENKQSKRNTRRVEKLANLMSRIHIRGTNSRDSNRDSPRRLIPESRRNGGTRRRTRRSRKSRK